GTEWTRASRRSGPSSVVGCAIDPAARFGFLCRGQGSMHAPPSKVDAHSRGGAAQALGRAVGQQGMSDTVSVVAKRRSVCAGATTDTPARSRNFMCFPTVDTWRRGVQAPAGGPGTQPLDLLGRGNGDRDDVVRRLRERDVQKRSEPATRFDFGAG